MRNLELLRYGLLWSMFILLSAPVWAQRGQGRGQRGPGAGGACQWMLASIPPQDLNAEEAAQLAFMREGEKLARDVYARLYELWGLPVFANISRSEQRHFEATGALIDRYRLPDPAAENPAGVFADSRLAALYADFTAQGQASAAAALRVGATIEELDIRDLETAIAATDNADLKAVYGNLWRASHNHLRAFAGQLQNLGESYQAQYLDPASLQDILSAQRGGMMSGAGGRGRRGNGPGTGICPWRP